MTKFKQTIGIIGATGTQGGAVARSLLQNESYQVRCITRDSKSAKAKELQSLGATVVQAQTDDISDLGRALHGCWGAYVNYTVLTSGFDALVTEELGKTILAGVAAAGVKHVVFSSEPHTERLSCGRIALKLLDVKAVAEKWALDNLAFDTFTPIMAGWYLENFQLPELEDFNGGFPNRLDHEGYYTCRFPFWGGREQVPWISMADDYGDLVHGIFLNPMRWNHRVVQAVADPMSFAEMVHTFNQVTGKRARFVPVLDPYDFSLDESFGQIPGSMFIYSQLRQGEYFPNGPTENQTAAQLKAAACRAKSKSERDTLMTVQEWFERHLTSKN